MLHNYGVLIDMNKAELEALAVEVAQKIGGQLPVRLKGDEDVISFALAYLAAVQERMEPVAKYNGSVFVILDKTITDGKEWADLYTSFAAPQEQKK